MANNPLDMFEDMLAEWKMTRRDGVVVVRFELRGGGVRRLRVREDPPLLTTPISYENREPLNIEPDIRTGRVSVRPPCSSER